jgi:hypothetical protein
MFRLLLCRYTDKGHLTGINRMKPHSPALDIAWRIDAGEAAAGSFPFIGKEHLLIGIFSIKKICADPSGEMGLDKAQLDGVVGECHALNEVLHPLGLGMTVLRRELRSGLGQGDFQHVEPVIHRSPSSRVYFQIADALAGSAAMVSSLHLLAAIAGEPGELFGNLLSRYGVESAELKKMLLARAAQGFKLPPAEASPDVKPKSYLERFGRDLTALAREGCSVRLSGVAMNYCRSFRPLQEIPRTTRSWSGSRGWGKAPSSRRWRCGSWTARSPSS